MRRLRGFYAATVLLVVTAGGSAGATTAVQAQALPRSSAVSAKLVLAKKQVTAGKPVRGTLVLTNRSTKKVDLNSVCTPKWEVVLGSGKEAPPVAFSMECGVAPFPVKPGRNKFPFEASSEGLEAGKYHAFLVASDPSFPTAKPAPVRIATAH
ncbi:MAG: hypothetical protein ACHQ52_12180 [Candidatus Eisenbacteria bacterium]